MNDVRGFGRLRGHAELYRGADYVVQFLPKTMIEVAVSDNQTGKAVDAIQSVAETGQIGDGKIFVSSVERARRSQRERCVNS